MKAVVGLVLASTLLLAGCYTGPDASHFLAVVDELDVPAGWQAAETVVRGPDQEERCDPFLSNECPAAIRSFVVAGDIDEAFAQAKDVVTAAGFSITDESTRCSGSSNSPACSFFANRGDDLIVVAVFSSPSAAGLEVDVPDAAAVVVHATSST